MKEKIYRMNADSITKEDRQAWAQWINSEPAPQFTMGPLVKEYEEKLAKWAGRKYAVTCNSGSSANLLMPASILKTYPLRKNKVIVPSAAWSTSISPFMQLGFELIMCEADPDNWGLDPLHLEELAEKHQPALVMLVHVLGVPANMNKIMQLQAKYGFILLEDACAALGSTYHGRKVGTFGKMATISTYAGHQLPTVEGGVVFTDDKKLHNTLLMLRNHGQPTHLDSEARVETFEKYGLEDVGTNFAFMMAGYNLRFNDVFAFIGLRQLERLEWMSAQRFVNHQLYKKYLNTRFQTQRFDPETTVSGIHFCALATNIRERNKIVRALEEEGISTRPFTAGNLGQHPFWFEEYRKFDEITGLVANRLYECGFFLPNHPYLTEEEIKFFCQTVFKSI